MIEALAAGVRFTLEQAFPGVVFKCPQFTNVWGTPKIGAGTQVGAFAEIGDGVVIGTNCKIGAYAFLPPGVHIGDNVFIGPRVTMTNDRYPPAPKHEWLTTIVRDGAVIGAGAVILPGVVIGERSLVGAGSVVTRNVPAGTVVYGNPARLHGEAIVHSDTAGEPQAA